MTDPGSTNILGSTVSHYRILSRIGDGGMGVVYLAEDIPLSRQAALKFLPEKSSTDPLVLERFLREARAASALNHPGICTIYEFGEHNGRPFLAMEYLEGQSLDKLLSSHALPLDRLLDLGIQAADAMDAAHRKGIIHRDIKPANLFLSPSGQLKVLDFGLAKLTESTASNATLGETAIGTNPNDTALITSAGSALGTVAFMSPEQARGETLDARTDLFSLGVVLYQLATGQHPFPGATTAVIFDQILNHAPTAPLELNGTLPAELERILNKALEKDRDFRYQSAADLRADLKRLRRETTSDRNLASPGSGPARVSGSQPATSGSAAPIAAASGSITAASGPVSATVSATVPAAQPAAAPAKAGLSGLWIAVAAVLLIAAAATAYWFLRPHPQPFSAIALKQITDSGNLLNLAMSPDGRTLVEVKRDKGQSTLWIRNIPTNTDTQILPAFGGEYVGLSFSPDGDNLYFSRDSEQSRYIRTLYSISVLGGTPRPLIRDVDSTASFAPDGSRFVYLRQTPELKDHFSEIHLVNKDLSGDEIIYQGPNTSSAPVWSPDGKTIAWNDVSHVRDTAFRLYDVGSRKTRAIEAPGEVVFGAPFAWMPDSSSVIASYVRKQTDRFQVGLLDLASGHLRPITNDLNSYGFLALSANGHTLAVTSATVQSSVSYYKAEGGNPVATTNLRISPRGLAWQDSNHLLFIGLTGIQSLDRTTQSLTPIDIGDLQVGGAITSCPDGHFLFTAIPKGVNHTRLFRANPDGSGLASITTDGIVRQPTCVSVSAPGDQVRYTIFDSQKNSQELWSIPVGGGAPSKLLGASTALGATFSLDGRLAATQAATGNIHDERMLVEIRDLTSPGTPARPLTFDPRFSLLTLRFSPDSTALVYPIIERGQHSLFRQPLDGSPGRIITDASPVPIVSFAWSPDGSQMVVLREQATSDAVLITDEAAQGSH